VKDAMDPYKKLISSKDLSLKMLRSKLQKAQDSVHKYEKSIVPEYSDSIA
jgi:hypothetical protein